MADLEIGWTKSGRKHEICTTTLDGCPFLGFQTMHSPVEELVVTNEFAHSLFRSRNQFLKTTNIMKTVCNVMLIPIRLIVIILKQF